MTDPPSREDDAVDAIVEAPCVATLSIRAGLSGRRVYKEGMNPSSERQLEADAYTDELLLRRLRPLDGVGEYASEERPNVTNVDEGVSITLDPLDGPTNLKSNNVMGTLYNIYDEPLPTDGENLLVAGYIFYDPVMTLVAGRDDVVSEYILESGTKRPLREGLALPGDPAVSSFGGRVNRWFDNFEAFARETGRTEEMKLRCGGSMIGDANQTLHYGGVFMHLAQTDASGGELR